MFGGFLNKIMKARKISGKELSIASDICQSTISKFLSGAQEPKYSQIIAISKALQIPPDAFMAAITPSSQSNLPFINEYCMVRDIFSDTLSNLQITAFYSFREFTMKIPENIHDDTLYIVVTLEGGTDSKLGSFRAGDNQIFKGSEYKGLDIKILKGTQNIIYIMRPSTSEKDPTWSKRVFEFVDQQKEKFLI